MGTRTKVLLVVVAVMLVCCFGGALVNGRGEGTGDANSSNGFVDFLAERAGSANAVADGEIEAPCRTAPATFQVVGTCTLTVVAGGAGMRSLVLRTDNAMTVSSRVPRKDFSVSGDVGAGEETRVPIDEQGGPVMLACASISGCFVTLGNGQ
jgi:hypothetical protein